MRPFAPNNNRPTFIRDRTTGIAGRGGRNENAAGRNTGAEAGQNENPAGRSEAADGQK
jgi:hypothetical protein